ncbi:hypothetical protein FRX31_021814 [Thalictrum thalictroides]|uniref:Uncharacterized protein n=1 Tax=Thalictrum thalictroides TaxID=46969 RepID=A0A7J6VWN1_THATH|nr:hypothetical protein FRX31_021814 [Thalictrum thalictroides]
MEDVGVVGFEEGRAWLPTHVLDEAFEPITKQQKNLWPQQERQRYHGGKDPSIRADIVSRNQHHKSSSKPPPRPRFQRGRASGGPGMQAIFIEPSHKPCGTGFFLPRKLGNNNFQMSKKPACSPVLLPSRVIQALNLNVHALGTQITTPRRHPENHLRPSKIRESTNNKSGKDRSESIVTTHTCVASVSIRSSSPEIFLPKEWTY